MGDFYTNMELYYPMRDAVGKAMEEIGDKYPDMVILTADIDTSARVKAFIKKYPERHFNMGIAEQNLLSFSAGMAHEGAIPYIFSFGPFLSMRACEQFRTDICYANLPVKLIASYAGYSGGGSGTTHWALEDAGVIYNFHNLTIVEPGDPFLAAKVLDAVMHVDGPVYVRMGNEASKPLYDDSVPYEVGKALIPRSGDDGAFICAGIVVHHAMEAAQKIKEDLGADIRVVDMHTLKPVDKEAVLSAAKTGRVVVSHDHNANGGLGSIVSRVICEAGVNPKFTVRGCVDKYIPLANADYLYHYAGYDAEGLYEAMKAFL